MIIPFLRQDNKEKARKLYLWEDPVACRAACGVPVKKSPRGGLEKETAARVFMLNVFICSICGFDSERKKNPNHTKSG